MTLVMEDSTPTAKSETLSLENPYQIYQRKKIVTPQCSHLFGQMPGRVP
jgi:hypothetical protein